MVHAALRLSRWVMFLVAMALVGLSFISQLVLVPADSFVAGFSFLPPIWVVVLMAIACLALRLTGCVRLNYLPLLVGVLYFISYGDYAILNSPYNAGPPSVGYLAKKLKVLALNVQFYNKGLSKVTDAIKKIQPDIVLLSENDMAGYDLNRIKESYHPLEIFPGQIDTVAIATQLNVLDFREVRLPTRQASLSRFNRIEDQIKNPSRSFVHAILDVEGTQINVISIRFIAGRARDYSLGARFIWGKYLLEQQTKEVDFFVNYISKLSGPVIFGGDLNAPASSRSIASLNRVAFDSYLSTNYFGDFTFRTDRQKFIRLDYLYSNRNARPLNSKVLTIKVSDHYPVYAEYQIARDGNALSMR